MILINFGTSEHFEKNVGTKYYCKSRRSAKKQLKEIISALDYKEATKEEVIHSLDKANTYSKASIQIEIKPVGLYIDIQEIDLI